MKKLSTAILLGMAFTSDDRYNATFLNNFVTINVLDRIASLPGVGEARLARARTTACGCGSIREDGDLGVTATDIATAIQAQNRQNPSGTIGQPPVASGVDLRYPVNAAGRLVEPQQFGDIVLRAQPDSSLLRIRDLARVELGAQDYRPFHASTKSRPASCSSISRRARMRSTPQTASGDSSTTPGSASPPASIIGLDSTLHGSCGPRSRMWS